MDGFEDFGDFGEIEDIGVENAVKSEEVGGIWSFYGNWQNGKNGENGYLEIWGGDWSTSFVPQILDRDLLFGVNREGGLGRHRHR